MADVWLKIVGLLGIIVCFTTYVATHLPSEYKSVYLRSLVLLFNNVWQVILSKYAWTRISKCIDCLSGQQDKVHPTKPEHRRAHDDEFKLKSGTKKARESNGVKSAMKVVFATMSALAFVAWWTCYLGFLRTGSTPNILTYVSFACLGFQIEFLLSLIIMDMISWLSKRWRRSEGKDKTSSSVVNVLTSFVFALLCLVYGLYTISTPPEIMSLSIQVPGLPQSLDGYRITQINDIHLGLTVGRNDVEEIVSIVNSLHSDALVLVGDLVDGTVSRLHGVADPLRNIQVRQGKYFVSGNHEYYNGDVDNWFSYVASLGFTVLHNSNVKIQGSDPSQTLCLAGTDDWVASVMKYEGHGFLLDKAVESCDPERPIVLLAHQPHCAKLALDSQHSNIKLVLSGHTHGGGQFFPITLVYKYFNYFQVGLTQYKDAHVYVSSGTKFWGVPFRIGTAMEITEITLRA